MKKIVNKIKLWFKQLATVERKLYCSDANTTRSNVPDVVIFGGDTFKLLSKSSSQDQGLMKSTKAMGVPGGCVVQVTTQQRNPDGSYAVAEALTFVPGVKVIENYEDEVLVGRKLGAL